MGILEQTTFYYINGATRVPGFLAQKIPDTRVVKKVGYLQPLVLRPPQNEFFDSTLGNPDQPDLFAHTAEQFCCKNEIFLLKTPKIM